MSPLDKNISKEMIRQAAFIFLSHVIQGKIQAQKFHILLEKEIPGKDWKRKAIKSSLEKMERDCEK
jgi:hypothetical protein